MRKSTAKPYHWEVSHTNDFFYKKNKIFITGINNFLHAFNRKSCSHFTNSKHWSRNSQHTAGIYSGRTNFDIIEGGLNDYISNLLSLNNIKKLAYENSDIDAIGRYGELKEEMSVEEFIMFVKTKLNLSDLRIVDGGNTKIRKVGIVTGSGIEYASNAFEAGCDAYLTGDIKYHDAQDWLGRGMNIFDVGHYGSEIHFKENMLRILRDKLGEEVDFVVSDALKDPFRAV